jgi:hypothetical protein
MLVSAAPLVAAVLLAPSRASADVGKSEASAAGKGTVGGALLGGELVCAVEAAAGVKNGWAYVGGAVGGAAAGGVGGYFLEQNTSARASMLVLAGGMTLVIPTIVLVLSQTAYAPPADYITDKPPADEPVANPPQPDTPAANPQPQPAAPPPTAPPAPATTPAPAAAPPPTTGPTSSAPRKHRVVARSRSLQPLTLTPPALLALRPGTLALNVPAVAIQDTYTRAEVAMYGVKQHTEVHIPVLDVVF